MRFDFVEPIPTILCHSCEKIPGVCQIVLNTKTAVLLCETCAYEFERQFMRQPLEREIFKRVMIALRIAANYCDNPTDKAIIAHAITLGELRSAAKYYKSDADIITQHKKGRNK